MVQVNRRVIIFIFSGLIFFLYNTTLSLNTGVASAETASTTLLVSVNAGTDTTTCGTEAQPCASIQYAANKANLGSTIRVAAGTYTYNAAADPCSSLIQITGVLCLLDKQLTIQGGFAASDWTISRPDVNTTVIDGTNTKRGILVQHADGQPASIITLEGFTVRNGRVQGASSGPDYATFAFGAGMLADNSTITLRNMVFQNNQALGGSTSSDYGGSAAGGGVAIRVGVGTSVLENVTFVENQVVAGSGANRGGFGIGGGLFTFETTLTGNNLTLMNNTARGGSTNGGGIGSDGGRGDGQGGGAAFHRNSTAVLTNVTAEGNRAIGGNAPYGQAGGSFGGGIWNEAASNTTITGATIKNNSSLGGLSANNAPTGAYSVGGGIGVHNSTLRLAQASVIDNQSIGGDGAVSGSGSGGGIAIIRTIGDSRSYVTNSVVANNVALMGSGSVSGGGGGGIYIRGGQVELNHITLAQNGIGSNMFGGGLVILNSGLPASASLSYSIIAQHTVPSGVAAIHALPGTTVTLQTGLVDGNYFNYGGDGTIQGIPTMRAAAARFRSPGAPNYDYHIEDASAARDSAVGSVQARDLDNDYRDSLPDVGADEYDVPRITALYAVTTSNNTVRVFWDSQGSAIERYEVIIFCPHGASAPNEVACGTPLDVGLQREVLFTGLTNGVEYNIELWAYGSGDVEFDSRSTTFTVADHFIFLPTVEH